MRKYDKSGNPVGRLKADTEKLAAASARRAEIHKAKGRTKTAPRAERPAK